MTPGQLRANPGGAARLVAWLGGYTRAGRALGMHRNVVRYAADLEYRERVAATNAEANTENGRLLRSDPERRAARNAERRAKHRRVVHLAKPGRPDAAWCGRAIVAGAPSAGRACRVCVRVACDWRG